MKIQFLWPPRPLGLGTPLNLVLASPSTRSLVLRNWWLPRAVTINGIAGIVLGAIYWWRGLELAILTHMVAIATVYIVLPLFT